MKIFIIALLLAIGYAQTDYERCFIREANTACHYTSDINIGDNGNRFTVGTEAKCAEVCWAHEDCVAFNYVHSGAHSGGYGGHGSGTCYYRTGTRVSQSHTDVRSCHVRDPTCDPSGSADAHDYTRHEGKHCGGSSINRWADGSNARYGGMSGIESCKAQCDAHAECAGFVQRDSDNKCGFWKKGPLNPHPNGGHHCYEKGAKATANEVACDMEFTGETTHDEHSDTFVFTADHDEYVFDTCGTDWDTMLAITDSNGEELFFNDDHDSDCPINGNNQYASHLEAHLTPGEEYTLKINGYCATCFGSFTINIACPGASEPAKPEYTLYQSKHCGGGSINRWADGSNARYGGMSGIENCKAECDAHPECAGFVQRDSDNKCGFWKSGPLNPHGNAGHHCYAKSTAEIEQDVGTAFQILGNTQSDGITMLAIFGALTTIYYGFKTVQKMMFRTGDFQKINEDEIECYST